MLKYRPVSEQDREALTKLIAQDSDHAGKCEPDFWLKPEDGVKLFAVQDEQGDLFYARVENIQRWHIQFCPDTERNKAAIPACLAEIAANSKKGYRQIIFESVYKPLTRFLKKHGFRHSPDEYVYELHEKTGV